jgi:hypothetical protein
MLGEGITQGRPVLSAYISRRHPFILILANRHTVPHGNRKLADERLESPCKKRPFNLDAANRIRPIAHDYRNAVARGGAQAVGHRVDVGVDPGADILEIDHQHVDLAQHFSSRFPRLAVERVNGDATRGILGVRRFHHVVLDV